jgi:tetratricopeptide (TPR) repeat protein
MDFASQRAALLLEQGRYADAEQELRMSLASDPDNAWAHAMLAMCLSQRKQFKDATAEAERAVGLAPNFSLCHYVLAKVLLDRDRTDEARTAIQQAIALDTYNANYYAMLAHIELSDRHWQRALDAAEVGLSINPDDVSCVNLRASALLNLGRKEEATAAIAGALARDPHNAASHANQGLTLLHQGQHKQALEHFREALRIDPTSEFARQGMVEALKARYLIYRLMLRYFLFMSRLTGRAQWGIVIGALVGFQLIGAAAGRSERLSMIILPLVIAYIGFAYLTYIATPLSNFLLCLNRFGRMVLSREQRIAALSVGAMLGAAVVCAVYGLVARKNLPLFAAVGFLGIAPPLASIFKCPIGWPRWVMAAYTAGLAIIGIVALILIPQKQADATQWIDAFLWGFVLQSWVVNGLMSVRIRR